MTFILIGYLTVSIVAGIGFFVGLRSAGWPMPLWACMIRGFIWPIMLGFSAYQALKEVKR